MTIAIVTEDGVRRVAPLIASLQADAANASASAIASQSSAVASADSQLEAAQSAAVAQAAALLADNIYPDTATGLAATAANGYFWTANPAKLYRKVAGVAVEQDALATQTFIRTGVNTQRLDVVLANVEGIQPEIHLTGINSSWLGGAIDVVWNARKGTNYVSLATVDTVNSLVNDLWMTQFRGFAWATTTAASTASTTVTVDDTTDVEVGMQISTAAMRAGGAPIVWPKVVSVDSATQVTLNTAVTIPNATAVRFGDNPTFGFGLTPPNKYTYRSQFGGAENEPTMGCVGMRLGAAQTGYAFGFYDSTNAHVWGWTVNNQQVYADGMRIKDASTPGGLLEFYKNDYNAVYQFQYNGDSMRFRFASAGLNLFQFNTDGSGQIYNAITFDKGITTKATVAGSVQAIQKNDGTVQYGWTYSGNDLKLRYDSGGVDVMVIQTTGRITFSQPVCTPVYNTVASLPSPSQAGMRAFVLDSTVGSVGNFGAIVAGGGSSYVPVWSDTANWRIG